MRFVPGPVSGFFKRLYAITQFLTTFPLKAQINVDEKEFGRSLSLAPLVGLFIGIVLSAVFIGIIKFLPLYICVAIIMLLYVGLTGALHIDGLADSFDAVFSRRSQERMLEIMKDSRIGTMGSLAMIFLIVFDGLFLYELLLNKIFYTLLLFPLAGRIGSVTTISLFKYARSSGMAKSFADYCGVKQLVYALIFSCIVFGLVMGLDWAALPLGIFIIAYLIAKYFSVKVGGITGDIAGAVCELNQLAFFFVLYLLFRIGVLI